MNYVCQILEWTLDGITWGRNNVPIIDLCTTTCTTEHERNILKATHVNTLIIILSYLE